MMAIDPLYLVVMAVSALLSLGAQAWVSAAFRRYKHVAAGHGLRGADVAELILRAAGVRGVRIEAVDGFLSDHYDPRAKVLRLSSENFHGRSIAAAGVAAHEVGHALQDARGYFPMRVRQALVPVANIGTNLGVLLVVIGMALGALGLAKIGVVLFAGFVAFTLVTLPVEIDASARAKRALAASGILDREELDAVSRVLRAAAATYVAAAATAVLQLLYFLLRVSGGHRREA
jgi:Zn-dependent membrane protease YugP